MFGMVKVELPWDQGVYRNSSTAGISCTFLVPRQDLIVSNKTIALFSI